MIIQDTIHDTIPLTKPFRWIRTGWSDQCTESVKRARRARRKWVAHGSQEAYIDDRQTVNEKKRQIKRDSKLGWRQTVADIMRDPTKMWRLTKWARTTAQEPSPPSQFPPMKDREGRHHSSNEDKAVMRILGIHLDSKLKWGHHINQTAAKAASHMASITRLTKSTWGATFAKG
jgi:hypothetical protein